MKKYLNTLKKCPLFYNIEDENLIKMLTCLGAKIEFFDRKYTIISEGKKAKHIGIVLSGSAQITQTDFYGNRNIISNIEPSQIFLEAFACAEIESIPITVTANEPSEIMLIDCGHIIHTCENSCGFHRQLIFNLMRELANKNLAFHEKIEVTSKRSTREKLMTYLMQTAKKIGKNSFDIPFDRQELADFLTVDRSGLSSEISKLKKEGIIESNKKHFTLL